MSRFPPYIKHSIKDPEKRELYLNWLTHELGENRYVVWEDLDEIGLKDGFEKLIQFKDGKRNLRAWRNLFEINEMVYKELVAEFMVTFQFDKTITKLNDDTMIRFNFLGKQQNMSLATFAKHLELYTEYQVTTSFFLKADREFKQRDHTAIWSELTGSSFQSNVKATSFIDKHHQVLHNLIACSIRGKRKTKGAVGQKDLLMIKSIIEQEHVNVAYLVADRILTESGYTQAEFAYMGSVITKLVRKMGLLTEDVISGFTPVKKRESKPYNTNYMVRVWLLEKDTSGQIRWKDGDIIPGVFMKPPRSQRVRVTFDDSTVHREPRNEVRHEREEGETSHREAEAQSPLVPPPRVFNWGDPGTSELLYGMLQMLNEGRIQDTYLAQEFGFPMPAPPTWVCGPLPPSYTTMPLHPFTISPLTNTIPTTTLPPPTTTITTTSIPQSIPRARRTRVTHSTEPVYSVHTTHEPHIPRTIVQPSSRAMTRPRPAESATSDTSSDTEMDSPQSGFGQDMQLDQDQGLEQTDYVPDMTTVARPTFSGLTGILGTNPVPSSELPPYPMHGTSLGSYEIADMGLDPDFHLFPIQPPASGRQHSTSSASVSRRASSGQHSATRVAAYSSMPPPAHGPPPHQDPPSP